MVNLWINVKLKSMSISHGGRVKVNGLDSSNTGASHLAKLDFGKLSRNTSVCNAYRRKTHRTPLHLLWRLLTYYNCTLSRARSLSKMGSVSLVSFAQRIRRFFFFLLSTNEVVSLSLSAISQSSVLLIASIKQ